MKKYDVVRCQTSTSWRVLEYSSPWSSVHPHPGAIHQGYVRKCLLTVHPALATSEVSSKLGQTDRRVYAQVGRLVKSQHGDVVFKSWIDKIGVDDDGWDKNHFPVATTNIPLVCWTNLRFQKRSSKLDQDHHCIAPYLRLLSLLFLSWSPSTRRTSPANRIWEPDLSVKQCPALTAQLLVTWDVMDKRSWPRWDIQLYNRTSIRNKQTMILEL